MKHNFPNNIDIICNQKLTTIKQVKDILKKCIDLEIPISCGVIKDPSPKEYPYIGWDSDDKEITLFGECIEKEGYLITNKAEFDEFMQGTSDLLKTKTIQLNDEYSAVISRKNVIVGCQHFSHEKIEELYNAIKKFKS